MLADYHTHTVFCKHAEGAVGSYIAAARKAGLDEICFTDHVPTPDGYDPENRMTMEQFPAYREAVLKESAGDSPAVLFGIEADYYQGGVDFLRAWLPKQELDLVLGSVHYIRSWGFDNPAERALWDSVDVLKTWREYFVLLASLADTRLFDIVAHLDLPKKFGYRPPERDIKEMVAPALDRIAAAGMAIELNTSGLRKPVKEIYPSLLILKMTQARGIPITFGSDAHIPEDVGYAFKDALELAKAAGYSECATFKNRKRQMRPLP